MLLDDYKVVKHNFLINAKSKYKYSLNELKISTQKQLNSLNKTLGKIKDKISKFKSFILLKGLDNDFKEYELKQAQEQEFKQKIEQEKDFLSLEVEHKSSHSYFNR